MDSHFYLWACDKADATVVRPAAPLPDRLRLELSVGKDLVTIDAPREKLEALGRRIAQQLAAFEQPAPAPAAAEQ